MLFFFFLFLINIYEILSYYFGYIFQPKVVTATDEAELARQMERAEAENAEVAGDDDEEEEDEGMTYNSGGEGEEDKEDKEEVNGVED